MTTGPSPINSSAAGTSLSGLAAQSAKKRNGESRPRVNSEQIADTFEATDREGDGRMQHEPAPSSGSQSRQSEIGDHIDLTG